MNTQPNPAPVPQAPQPTQAAAPPVAPAPQPQPQPTPAPPPAPAAPMAEKTHLVPHDTNDLLENSIDDAYTLLNFACRRGIQLDKAAAKVIVDSHGKVQGGLDLTSAEQCTFWESFSTVIDRVKPVTVESIVYTRVKDFKGVGGKIFGRLSHGERALRQHLLLAILTLGLLLVLQVQWAIGTSIYNDAYKVHGHYLSAQTALSDATKMAKAVANTDVAAQTGTALETAQRQLDDDTSWRDVSYVRLWWWNRGIAVLLPPYDLSVEQDGPANSAGSVKLTLDGERRIEFTRAELTLEMISNYLLVTLFALLGAVTQALRTLSRKMADVALTSNDVFRGMTRIILGVISGVCMAWLYIITMQTNGAKSDIRAPLDIISFLGAFAPWALAFISGYSVEIFFTALERFIAIVIAKIKGATPLPGSTTSGAAPALPPVQPQPENQTSIK